MRTTGNVPMIPGPVVREKKVSSFKTISFLVSLPEYESGMHCSDHKDRDMGNPADIPGPRGE
jgi:hypothetical protein